MGKCWNCEKYITLNDFETKCDECKKVVNYCCWYCKEWFSIFDEEEEEKRKECGVCGFFVCPSCGSCGTDCQKDQWQSTITEILAPEIGFHNIPNLQKKINKILSFIEDIKISKDQRKCFNGVPISYAKNRIKSCVARMMGYRVKNEGDMEKFNERLEEIMNLDLGTEITINKAREEGSYGQEYRDVFNYCICLGKLKKQMVSRIIDGEKNQYESYRRVEDGTCQYLEITNIIFKQCPKCKEQYPRSSPQEYCYACGVYKKGKDKGQPPKLRLKLSNKDTCQLNRGSFEKDGESKYP